MGPGSTFQKLEVNRTLFEAAGRRYDFCPCLLGGIAWSESRGIVQAVNPDSGTVGLMQIHPVHFQSLGWKPPTYVNRSTRTGSGGFGWSDAGANIDAGAQILRSFVNRYGQITRSLQGYLGASKMDSHAVAYIEAVLMTTIKLAGYYRHYGRWAG